MATAFIIQADEDRLFVRNEVLWSLPSNGYYHWVSSLSTIGKYPDRNSVSRAMNQCQVILIILSPSILKSESALLQMECALKCKHRTIVIQISLLSEQENLKIPEGIGTLLRIDMTLENVSAVTLLNSLLPPFDKDVFSPPPKAAEQIEWNEKIFSSKLCVATTRHDHAGAKFLVYILLGHLNYRLYSYPPEHANRDLQMLRQEREFELMRQYAEAVIKSGTVQDQLLRLYGQSLIETGRYHEAREILLSIIKLPDSSLKEVFEARGLIGRIFKQFYINEPNAAFASEYLSFAIQAYESAYIEDKKNFWHGVNAVSCMIRAERYNINITIPGRAKEIARQIVHDLNKLSKNKPLEVWDCASNVEALLALENYAEANHALDIYLNHPNLMAFEVFSTFRQFSEVLELGRNKSGAVLLERLRNVMERYRAGNLAKNLNSPSLEKSQFVDHDAATKSLVIRLSAPDHDLNAITALSVQSRMGKIVTASGTKASVLALLEDPKVISIQESLPAGGIECDRSLPFIRVAALYSSSIGQYAEAGDHALIALIDDGIDVLHHAFLNAHGKSRIVGIWDQTDASGPPPLPFTYGTFHDDKSIASYVEKSVTPNTLGRNETGHGTHVASIAAGRACGVFKGGIASEAQLLIIKSACNGPVGYSRSHIDALSFINSFAEKVNLPVVVNVSQGMNSGAHDGKSALEVAFDGFSEGGRKSGRVVVKSAGNERAKGGHARITLKSEQLETLRWTRSAGADYLERIELWWSSADVIRVRLGEAVKSVTWPNLPSVPASWSDWVEAASPKCEGVFPLGGPFHLVLTKRHVDNGDSMLSIVLGNEREAAGLGDWVLQIEGISISKGEIHSWIERNQGLPTRFQLPHVSEDMTLSIPGTSRSVISVGAVDACKPLQIGAFSSYGPTRGNDMKPTVCAPGIMVNAACGGTQQDIFPESGTSMAAPHVAGAIALLLSRQKKLGNVLSSNQIDAGLQVTTQKYDGNWDRGLGFGLIDVAALLAAFE